MHNLFFSLVSLSPPNHTLPLAKAGMSLGFDLKGSLAAIDQWVEDMGDDDEEDLDIVREDLLDADVIRNNTAGHGVLGGVGGGAAMDTYTAAAGGKTPDVCGGSSRSSSRAGSAGSSGRGGDSQRILSRDAILTMVKIKLIFLLHLLR